MVDMMDRTGQVLSVGGGGGKIRGDRWGRECIYIATIIFQKQGVYVFLSVQTRIEALGGSNGIGSTQGSLKAENSSPRPF